MIPKNKNLRHFAKELRNNATKQENHLWYDFLREHPFQFNRQYIILNYIADFYCSKAKLVIELDGSQHYTPEGITYDTARTQMINQLKIEVLRFKNHEIDHDFKNVCKKINDAVHKRTD